MHKRQVGLAALGAMAAATAAGVGFMLSGRQGDKAKAKS